MKLYTYIKVKGIFYVLFFISLSIQAQEKNEKDVAFFVSYYNHFSESNTLEKVMQKPFKKVNNNVINKGFTSQVLWVKIELQKKSNTAPNKWVLIAGRPLIDSITVYKLRSNKWVSSNFGFMQPKSKRPLFLNKSAIPLTINDTLKKTLYLKIKSRSALELPFTLVTETKFQYSSKIELLFMGILYGGILVMILYNLFLYFIVKDISFLYYVLSTATALIVQSILKGHTSLILFPEHPNISFYTFFIFIYLNVFFSTLFCFFILGLQKSNGKGGKLLKIIGYLSVLLLPSVFIVDFDIAGPITVILVLIYSVILLYVGVINWITGNKIAKLFSIAWTAYLIGIIINILKTLNVVPLNWFTINIGHIGSFVEVVLFSFILGYRYNLLKNEKELLQKEFTAKLNAEVIQKTKEISIALTHKNDLLSEVHHRVKNNLQVVYSLFNLQERRVKTAESKRILESGKNKVRSMSLVHEHLYKNDSFKEINSKNYLTDLISYLSGIYKKPIQIKNNIDAMLISNDLAIPLGIITSEVISNSFKYAFKKNCKNPEIVIKFYNTNTTYVLEISDNGVGFNYEKYTKEKHSLGIQLIKGMTQQLNGEVHITTTNGVSYQFIFPHN